MSTEKNCTLETVSSSDGRQRLSSWIPARVSESFLEDEDADVPLEDYLAREVLKYTVQCARELEDVWTQVGTNAKMRVADQLIGAIRMALDACIKQEKVARDSIVSHIDETKGEILVVSRKLGLPTPAEGESDEVFFFGKDKLETLVDKLAILEMKLESLNAQQAARSRVVEDILNEMRAINSNMDREPEPQEMEPSGPEHEEETDCWELSQARVEKLRERLEHLKELKEERAAEMVELVVACQRLHVQLGLQCTNPLQSKMMMSLDPSSPEDHPTLRTEEQTQTSVGLSAYNVDRLKKLRANMEEDRELHMKRKEECRAQIEILWEKLHVPMEHQKAHLDATKGITHTDMETLEAELSELKRRKAERLHDMIISSREKISRLLEDVGAKPEEVLKESARDLHVPKEDWSEELLENHEEFITMLGGMGERAAKIKANVQKREKLVQMRERVGSSTVDYRARGGTGLQHQAKVIDGMRKEVRKLPALTDELRRRLRDWHQDEGFPFRYNNREYLKVIEESDTQWQHRKEVKMRSRMYGGTDPAPISPQLVRRGGGSGSGSGSSGTGSGVDTIGPHSPGRSNAAMSGSLFHTTGGNFQRPQSARLASGGVSNISVLFSGSSPGVAPSAGGTDHYRTASGSSLSSGILNSSGYMIDNRGPNGQHGEGSVGSRSAGGSGEVGVAGGSVDGRTPVTTPSKDSRNPLLNATPSSRGIKPRLLASTFASTGGSIRLPPPPLPARPGTTRTPQALSRMQSSPDLGIQRQTSPTAARYVGGDCGSGDDSTEPEDSDEVDGVVARAVPPPLPDRSLRAPERVDLTAIRESDVSSARSSASVSEHRGTDRHTGSPSEASSTM